MMGNRKQPFGYKMELGRVAVNQPEAELVQYIFRQYVHGLSYKELVEFLQKQDVPYEDGKIWNKNMVARILGDERYIGAKNYTAIIKENLFQSVAERRAEKQCHPQKTEAQKLLRRLCGQAVSQKIEQEVTKLLNSLIQNPEQIRQQESDPSTHAKAEALESELNMMLDCNPVDEEKAKQLIYELMAARYESIGSSKYETQRMKRLFDRKQAINELNAELLKSAVSSVVVSRKNVVLILKNGQEMGGDGK